MLNYELWFIGNPITSPSHLHMRGMRSVAREQSRFSKYWTERDTVIMFQAKCFIVSHLLYILRSQLVEYRIPFQAIR